MKNILFIGISALIILCASRNTVAAQGCVAIRGNASTCMLAHPEHTK